MTSRIGWLLVAALMALASCGANGGAEVPGRPDLPSADFATRDDQFAALQHAALTADYGKFANVLGASDPAEVVARLNQAFGGDPFDVYTDRAETDSDEHERLIELRGTKGRLYLYVRLEKAPGGWNMAGYELGRDRAAIAGRL